MESTPTHHQEKTDTYDPRTDTLYRGYLWATVIGVFGGFLGIGLLTWQSILLRQSANAAKVAAEAAERSANAAVDNVKIFISKERARLSVHLKKEERDIDEPPFEFGDLAAVVNDLTGGTDDAFFIAVHKYGPTDAEDIEAFGQFGFCNVTPDWHGAYRIHEFPTKLGGDTTAEMRIDVFVTPEQINEIEEGGLIPRLFGYVSWKDIFGKRYDAPFCYWWDQQYLRWEPEDCKTPQH